MFWNKWQFCQISWFKFGLMLVLSNLFYGFFSLFLTSITENVQKIENVWKRAIFPLWYLGCYLFSWNVLTCYSPQLAYVALLNPIVYCMEGMRVALFGQEGSIDFWYSVAALCVFCMIAGYFGIKNMKQRLDCL